MFYKNDGRQATSVATVEFDLADLVDGPLNVVELAGNSIVTGGFITVTTPFNAGTTATVKLGDSTNDARYGTNLSVATTAKRDLVVTGLVTPRLGDLVLTYASTGAAATAGKAVLVLEYVELSKSNWTQG